MSSIALGDDTIVQELTIESPAHRIFEALTDPAHLLKWWAVEGKFRLIHAECDLRVGGKWLMRVFGSCNPDCAESVVHGVYLTIEPPRSLVFTWIREEEDCPETLVRWDLEEHGGVTAVRVTHSGLANERLRARHSGWPMVLTLLQTYLEK